MPGETCGGPGPARGVPGLLGFIDLPLFGFGESSGVFKWLADDEGLGPDDIRC